MGQIYIWYPKFDSSGKVQRIVTGWVDVFEKLLASERLSGNLINLTKIYKSIFILGIVQSVYNTIQQNNPRAMNSTRIESLIDQLPTNPNAVCNYHLNSNSQFLVERSIIPLPSKYKSFYQKS